MLDFAQPCSAAAMLWGSVGLTFGPRQEYALAGRRVKTTKWIKRPKKLLPVFEII